MSTRFLYADDPRPRSGLMRHVTRWLIIAVAVLIAAHTNEGISYQGPGAIGHGGWGTLAIVVVVLSGLNFFLKPLLVFFTLPFIVLTLGFGLVVVNGAIFWTAAQLVPGFEVSGFWPAVWGGIVVSLVSIFANWLLAPRRSRPGRVPLIGHYAQRTPSMRGDDDAIDI